MPFKSLVVSCNSPINHVKLDMLVGLANGDKHVGKVHKYILNNLHLYWNIIKLLYKIFIIIKYQNTLNHKKGIDNTPNLSHNKKLVGDILKCIQFKASPYS